jgi:hypothetical protein
MLARYETNEPWLVALGFLGFAGIWLGGMKLMSWRSGWRELASRFASAAGMPAKWHSFCSIGSKSGDYRGCMAVGISPGFLHLAGTWLFRPFHPPLAIPWTSITGMGPHPLDHAWIGLSFQGSHVVFYFREPMLAEIRAAWEKHRGGTK